MFIAIISIHILVCILLIIMILIQRGRGGGLVESFSGVESMFGTKTNTLLTRLTTVLAIMFLLSCLVLAFISAQKSKSVFEKIKPESSEQLPVKEPSQLTPNSSEGETSTQESQ